MQEPRKRNKKKPGNRRYGDHIGAIILFILILVLIVVSALLKHFPLTD